MPMSMATMGMATMKDRSALVINAGGSLSVQHTYTHTPGQNCEDTSTRDPLPLHPHWTRSSHSVD